MQFAPLFVDMDMAMTFSDLGAIANLIASIGMLVTLIYLSRQVKQGNMLAKSHTRQRMVEQAHAELYELKNDAVLRNCFVKKEELSPKEHEILHYFLLAAMRQREWEWFQHRDGVIGKEVYEAYHEVIAIHLGIARTRKWWGTIGRIAYNPTFVIAVDSLLATRQLTGYFEGVRTFDRETTGQS